MRESGRERGDKRRSEKVANGGGGGDGDNITSCNLYFVFRSSAHHHVIRILRWVSVY